MSRAVQVFGPAYLDRVLLVDQPLVDPRFSRSLDQSVDGTWKFGRAGLTMMDAEGSTLTVDLPADWPGPTGELTLSGKLGDGPGGWSRRVRGLAWHDDLGGMGAGYAAALGGELVGALGGTDDPMSRAVASLLEKYGVVHEPIRIPERAADWTLLITSGPFGDKLPVGFRGCHVSLEGLAVHTNESCDLRVVASLPNRLAAEALSAPGAKIRLFAPTTRNMVDREPAVSEFTEAIDVVCCNLREWELLEDREEVAWQVSILAVTDGPRGSLVRFTTPQGEPGRVRVPVFPRERPPRDTNRAGEAFASCLIASLLAGGWVPGVADEELVRAAAERAAAAAALVLDRTEFGFPNDTEIDEALRAGVVR